MYTHLLYYTYILWPNSSQYKYTGDRQKQGRPPKFETIEYIKTFNLKYLKINKYNNQCKQTPTCLKYNSTKYKSLWREKRRQKYKKILKIIILVLFNTLVLSEPSIHLLLCGYIELGLRS